MPRTRNGKPEDKPKAKKAKPKRAAAKRASTKSASAGAKPPDSPAVDPQSDDAADPEKKRGKMTMWERVHLAERLAAARLKKPKADTWEVIARREGVPLRTCKHVYAWYQEQSVMLGDASGRMVLEETLLLHSTAIERLAWEAEFGETSAARVGAMRTLLDALKGRVELLAVMGRMPRSFRAMDELAALQRYVRRLVEIVEQHNLPPEVVEDFVLLADEIQPVIEGSSFAVLPRAS